MSDIDKEIRNIRVYALHRYFKKINVKIDASTLFKLSLSHDDVEIISMLKSRWKRFLVYFGLLK